MTNDIIHISFSNARIITTFTDDIMNWKLLRPSTQTHNPQPQRSHKMKNQQSNSTLQNNITNNNKACYSLHHHHCPSNIPSSQGCWQGFHLMGNVMPWKQHLLTRRIKPTKPPTSNRTFLRWAWIFVIITRFLIVKMLRVLQDRQLL